SSVPRPVSNPCRHLLPQTLFPQFLPPRRFPLHGSFLRNILLSYMTASSFCRVKTAACILRADLSTPALSSVSIEKAVLFYTEKWYGRNCIHPYHFSYFNACSTS